MNDYDSGIRGVVWHKKNNKWILKLKIDGERKYLGSFSTLDEVKDFMKSNKYPIESNKGGTKYSYDESYFNEINTPQKAFWLGFICADGSVHYNRTSKLLKITQLDNTLLNEFKSDLKYTGKVNLITTIQKGRYSDKPFYELCIYSNNLCNQILNLGKTLYKSDLKNIPKSIPKEFIFDFIRGYFEGDGSLFYAKSSNSWGFNLSGNKELLEDIQNFLKIGTIHKDKSIYRLSSKGNNVTEKLVNLIYYSEYVSGIKCIKYKEENLICKK